MSDADGPHPSIAATIGVLQIGTALSLFCSGVLSLQTWNYYHAYKHDILLVKLAVGVVHANDLVHSGFLMHALYQYTVTFFGDHERIRNLVFSMRVTSVFHGAGIFFIQLFFCRRIYYLERSAVQAALASALAVARFICNVLIMVTCLSSAKANVYLSARFRWQVTCLLSVGLASDVANTFCICRSLLRQRSGLRTSDGLVDRLVAFTIGSGMLTSVIALAELISFFAIQDYIFLLFYFLLGKVYSNALLASLNERSINRIKFDIAPSLTSARLSREVSLSVRIGRSRSRRRSVRLDGLGSSLELDERSAKTLEALHDARLA